MNRQGADILLSIHHMSNVNQRELAQMSGHSLGSVNKVVKQLTEDGHIDADGNISNIGINVIEQGKTKSAIILAAGFGMRMVPINMEVSKGMIQVHGEPLIERHIKHLKEAGIHKIYVIVGFMKEQYEYLMDEYGVDLIVNPEYSIKNNLHSLALVRYMISNTYIIPCDIYCKENPFRTHELYSWYMVTDAEDEESFVRINRKRNLISNRSNELGNRMIGISYIDKSDAQRLIADIEQMCRDKRNDGAFWEAALFADEKKEVAAKVVSDQDVFEINTYEQLRDLDCDSHQLNTEAMDIIEEAFDVDAAEITNIDVLKKGMTNRSFLFQCKNAHYIMRIPGEGTDELINRKQEAAVYEIINKRGISDNVLYLNEKNGYKITEYFEGARACDAENIEDLKSAMRKLRDMHEQKLTVEHRFDLFEQIDFYESLWREEVSAYRDYKETKANVLSLQSWIEAQPKEECLAHVDAVADNFLFVKNLNGEEEVRLIDWEYAGMQDPHVDIAMFCIYSMYDREQVDELIDIYFEGVCDKSTRTKIYAYIAVAGLLWSNWCEYKRQLGVEFGEYSLRQYRYAKDYYRLVKEELGNS